MIFQYFSFTGNETEEVFCHETKDGKKERAILEYAFVTVGLTFLEFYSRNLDVFLSSDCHVNVFKQDKKL